MHTQAQKDAIHHCAKETYEKIKAMSWQEIVENGTELGATMIFDTLALHALSGFASKAGRAVVERISNAMEKGAPLAQQYALEVAGFGKVVTEEGVEAATKAAEIIKNNPEILTEGRNTAQVIQKITNNITETKNLSNISIDSTFFSNLRPVGDNIWESPGNLIYGHDKKFGNNINHVLTHTVPNPAKELHSVFSIPKNKIITLLDEAWALKQSPLVSDQVA
ncbi:hypothetical protein K2W90_02915 [Candidatus Babeliales bacterium]|nr:hypothetical protein [Candidatus Babeliales bacterium]